MLSFVISLSTSLLSPSLVDISNGRKWTTSGNLDQYYGDSSVSTPKQSSSTGKKPVSAKQSKNNSAAPSLFKSAASGGKSKTKNSVVNSTTSGVVGGQFPYPYLQIEFKESMYLTEVALQTTKAIDDLKHFQIRIGDDPITKFYEEAPSSPSTVKPFDGNRLCYEYESTSKGFFEFSAVRKQNSFVKSVKCLVSSLCSTTDRLSTDHSLPNSPAD